MAVGDQNSRRVAVAIPGMLAGGILETRGRRRVTVRFTMVEGSRMALGFCMVKVGFEKSTVRITDVLRKDIKGGAYRMR
jgi:hypothetical protein